MQTTPKQRELLLEAWRETVTRVKPLRDVDKIADEWMALGILFVGFATEAFDRYRLHALSSSSIESSSGKTTCKR